VLDDLGLEEGESEGGGPGGGEGGEGLVGEGEAVAEVLMVVGAFRGGAGEARGEVGRWGGEEVGRGGGVAKESEISGGIRAERTSMKLRRARPEHWRCVFNSGAPCIGRNRDERMGGKTSREKRFARLIWSTSHHRSIM